MKSCINLAFGLSWRLENITEVNNDFHIFTSNKCRIHVSNNPSVLETLMQSSLVNSNPDYVGWHCIFGVFL